MTSPDDIPPWHDDTLSADEVVNSSGTVKRVNPSDGFNTVEGYIHAETLKAILFEVQRVNGTDVASGKEGKKEWFPLSQTKSVTHAVGSEDYDIIRVSDWIARTKGII